ncbi:MAG: UvrB/UvrC motif-containing protein [Synergistaceae bacterium]
MFCERCGKNIADVFLVKMIGGKRFEEHLCHECAQAFLPPEEASKMMKMSLDMSNIPPQLQEMLRDMIAPGVNNELDFFPDNIPCPHCGEMISKDYIRRVLEEQGDYETDETGELNVPMTERESLERMMELAVSEENYEEAAKIKDRIKKLDEISLKTEEE